MSVGIPQDIQKDIFEQQRLVARNYRLMGYQTKSEHRESPEEKHDDDDDHNDENDLNVQNDKQQQKRLAEGYMGGRQTEQSKTKQKKQEDSEEGIVTECFTVPVTLMHPVGQTANLSKEGLENPGLPRFHAAATKEHPQGTEGHPTTRSVLQQHVDFFDRDKDGIITMSETFAGFRALGFNVLFSLLAVFVIHSGFALVAGFKPWYSPLFDPFFRLQISKIHRVKHGSDTGVFDTEGRFVPQKFEELWYKWKRSAGKEGQEHKDDHDYLTLREVYDMTQGMWNALDFYGWYAAKFEWFTTWLLCADEKGRLHKESVRGVYDGSLFYKMEEQQKQRRRYKARKNN